VKPLIERSRQAQAWASYLVWRLGPLGGAGLALAAAAVALTLITQWFWQPATLQAEQALVLLQRQQASRTVKPVSAADERGWVAQLPAVQAVPEVMAGLQEQALRAGVRIERAEYRAPTAEGELRRMQVVLPMQGSYSGVKRWLGRVLQAHPSCALDELSFQRRDGNVVSVGADNPPRSELQARVVLSFYLREAP
jgi:hypothetical protein